MFIERFEDKGLSQYSYAVGCEGAGQMAVVDPRRDGDIYLYYAAQRGLRISHVLETHIHADLASGARELAERSGAELWLSAYDAGGTYEVGFTHAEMFDGDSIGFGSVRIQALHTPGHTPEHLSFLVFDQARSADVPMTMLSGVFYSVHSLPAVWQTVSHLNPFFYMIDGFRTASSTVSSLRSSAFGRSASLTRPPAMRNDFPPRKPARRRWARECAGRSTGATWAS